MDIASGEIELRSGDDVYTSDEQKIGSVSAFDRRYLTVEHGLLLKSHYYIPCEVINTAQEGRVYLNVAKDDISAQGWDNPPAMATEADGGVVH